jgi:hypothetical protein
MAGYRHPQISTIPRNPAVRFASATRCSSSTRLYSLNAPLDQPIGILAFQYPSFRSESVPLPDSQVLVVFQVAVSADLDLDLCNRFEMICLRQVPTIHSSALALSCSLACHDSSRQLPCLGASRDRRRGRAAVFSSCAS